MTLMSGAIPGGSIEASMSPSALRATSLPASPTPALLALAYPAQVLRLTSRDRGPDRSAAALFTVLGKVAEAQGAMDFHLRRLRGRRRAIIEYK